MSILKIEEAPPRRWMWRRGKNESPSRERIVKIPVRIINVVSSNIKQKVVLLLVHCHVIVDEKGVVLLHTRRPFQMKMGARLSCQLKTGFLFRLRQINSPL